MTATGKWGHAVFVLVMSGVALGGCQLYWYKADADFASFTADHQACLRRSGIPIDEDRSRVRVDLDVYRACLKARGWARVERTKNFTEPGYFRGQEKEGPVGLDEPPTQVPAFNR